MKQHRSRKCRHCLDLFDPDTRNLRHQRYCSKPACRKASKADSQRRWLGKAQNPTLRYGLLLDPSSAPARGLHERYSTLLTLRGTIPQN